MKKSTLFILSTLFATTMLTSTESKAFATGWSIMDMPPAHITCWSSPAAPACPADVPFALTIWMDPFVAAATVLDAVAVDKQQEKTVDASDAVDELEESLKSSGSCSGSSDDTVETVDDIQVLGPETVINLTEKGQNFDAVRTAVEDYEFVNSTMNGDCKLENPECANQRQETWTFLSVATAEATMDKIIAKTNKMDFSDLKDKFNATKSPADMWSAMSNITLNAQSQANDLNAIYARELEMNALMGISESGVEKIGRSSSTSSEDAE